LNLALVSSLVWPQWPIGSQAGVTAMMAWVCVLGLWVLGLTWTQRTWPRLCPPGTAVDPQIDEWFREAQIHYLKGHWIEAETLLARLLVRQPADAEARLLLAAVQRRAKQWTQARKNLNELREQSTGGRWQREIEIELSQLAELEQADLAGETTASSDVQQPSIRRAA
jgi:thioredoxin-like negative regulator of GroEL